MKETGYSRGRKRDLDLADPGQSDHQGTAYSPPKKPKSSAEPLECSAVPLALPLALEKSDEKLSAEALYQLATTAQDAERKAEQVYVETVQAEITKYGEDLEVLLWAVIDQGSHGKALLALLVQQINKLEQAKALPIQNYQILRKVNTLYGEQLMNVIDDFNHKHELYWNMRKEADQYPEKVCETIPQDGDSETVFPRQALLWEALQSQNTPRIHQLVHHFTKSIDVNQVCSGEAIPAVVLQDGPFDPQTITPLVYAVQQEYDIAFKKMLALPAAKIPRFVLIWLDQQIDYYQALYTCLPAAVPVLHAMFDALTLSFPESIAYPPPVAFGPAVTEVSAAKAKNPMTWSLLEEIIRKPSLAKAQRAQLQYYLQCQQSGGTSTRAPSHSRRDDSDHISPVPHLETVEPMDLDILPDSGPCAPRP